MKTIAAIVLLPLALPAQPGPRPAAPPSQQQPQAQPQQQPPQQGGGPQRGGPGGRQQRSAQETQEVRPEDAATLEGQVTNAATGEPLNKVNLTLRRAGGGPGGGGMPGAYAGSTDAGGRFSITGIAPGRYTLTAVRNGFVDADYGSRDPQRTGSALAFSARQRMTGLVFPLVPHAVIAGRILDEDGEPMASVNVEALKYRYSQARKQLVSYGEATTNDIGEYRIYGLPAGKYFVRATSRRGFMPDRFVRSNAQQTDDQYVPLYYPGATEPASAALVEVSPGGQIRGVDFPLAKRRTVRVKGRVAKASGSGEQRVMVFLRQRGAPAGGMGNRPSPVDANGNFEIRGVVPGSYILVATVPDRRSPMSGRVPLEVGNAGADGVSVSVLPPMSLNGAVRIDGEGAPQLTNVQVTIRPRESSGGFVFGPGPSPAKVQANGQFSVGNVTADEYSISVSGLPDGYYVRSILAGGRDVLLSGIDLSSGVALPLDVVLSPKAGQAAGVVQNDQQEPAAGVTVVLIPQERERRELAQYYRTATTDASGRFTFSSLDPGQYKVYAWKEVESGSYYDPDFIRPIESRGEAVIVKESSREEVQVKLIG